LCTARANKRKNKEKHNQVNPNFELFVFELTVTGELRYLEISRKKPVECGRMWRFFSIFA